MSTCFKFFAFSILFLFLAKFSFSQDVPPSGYFNDAIQFSQTTFGGSARYLGLAGATTSLGADIGAGNSNPAGLGFFKKSEFSISPAFNFAGSTSNYLGGSRNDNRQNFNIGNIGVVFAGPVDDLVGGSWRGGAFSITHTRINNFQNQYSFGGTNQNNSMTNYFAERTSASGVSEDQLINDTQDNYYSISDLAYKTFLIDSTHQHNVPFKSSIRNSTTKQSGTVLNRGNQYSWDFAYGGNINDKIYIGATLGVPTINYTSDKSFKETIQAADTNAYGVTDFTFTDYLKITGTGINFKIGSIFKLVDRFRFGVTLQSPTLYSVKTEYQYGVKTNFNGLVSIQNSPLVQEKAKTVLQYFNYNLTGPARAKVGASYFFGKHGFISTDIEFVTYRSAHLSLKRKEITDDTDLDFFVGDNQYIHTNLKTAANISVGGEYRIDIFRLRAGAALIKDPYSTGVLANAPKQTLLNYLVGKQERDIVNFTFGGGIRLPEYYFDVSFVNTRYKGTYTPYNLNNGQQPTAKIKTVNTNFMITFGAFF